MIEILKVLCLSIVLCNACVPVASYQKMYINDEEMALKERQVEVGEINALTYREGAAGAVGGKSGGGCGCN
jgi:hypothetical protein